MLSADTLCLDGPDVQEGKRRSIARVTIVLCLVSKYGMARLSEVIMVAAGDLTCTLRCFAIRSLGTAADRRRGINEQIFGQPGGSLFLSGGYNILVIRLVYYFAE